MQHPKLLMKIGDGEEFNIADKVPSLEYLGDDSTVTTTNQLSQVAGVDGAIYQYKTFNNYQVPAKFFLRFGNWQSFKLAKHEIQKIFSTKKIIRIRTDTETAIVRFVLANDPEIHPAEDLAHYSLFTVNFDNPSGYRYSIFRSDTMYDFAKSGWQIGMNIPVGEKLNYHFTDKIFKVYNASDVPVDPYYGNADLKIICKFSGDKLTLTNKTNGSTWTYNKASTGSDSIILDGINTTLNGKTASVNTDYGNLSLETGWNDVEATGANSVDITFSFPFIYR